MWGQDISQKKSKKYYATKYLSVLQLCPKVKNIPHLCCARKIPQEKLLETERTRGIEENLGPLSFYWKKTYRRKYLKYTFFLAVAKCT